MVYKDVPRIIPVPRQVPKIEKVQRFVEVPEVQYIDKVIEVTKRACACSS